MNIPVIQLIKITRPVNVLLTFISVWLAAFISPNFQVSLDVFAAALSAASILAAGNVINDIYDLEIDRLNRPRRPLPSGRLSIKSARILYILLNSAGLIPALFLGPVFTVIALLVIVLMFYYSRNLKKMVLWGNFTVSLATGLTFIYGALAVDDVVAGLIPAVFAFLFHFGREIIKDMQDADGDRAGNANTLPIRYGYVPSISMVTLLFSVLILLTLFPYIFKVYPLSYLVLVVPAVDGVLAFVAIALWRRRDKVFLGVLSTVLKIDMFVGLMAVWLGARNVNFFN